MDTGYCVVHMVAGVAGWSYWRESSIGSNLFCLSDRMRAHYNMDEFIVLCKS